MGLYSSLKRFSYLAILPAVSLAAGLYINSDSRTNRNTQGHYQKSVSDMFDNEWTDKFSEIARKAFRKVGLKNDLEGCRFGISSIDGRQMAEYTAYDKPSDNSGRYPLYKISAFGNNQSLSFMETLDYADTDFSVFLYFFSYVNGEEIIASAGSFQHPNNRTLEETGEELIKSLPRNHAITAIPSYRADFDGINFSMGFYRGDIGASVFDFDRNIFTREEALRERTLMLDGGIAKEFYDSIKKDMTDIGGVMFDEFDIRLSDFTKTQKNCFWEFSIRETVGVAKMIMVRLYTTPESLSDLSAIRRVRVYRPTNLVSGPPSLKASIIEEPDILDVEIGDWIQDRTQIVVRLAGEK